MGGNSSSTPQDMGSQLSSLFMNNGGYQGGQGQTQLPTIQAPQYGPMLNPSPQQAAAATMARMRARTPMAAPVAAPTMAKPQERFHGEGSAGGRGGEK